MRATGRREGGEGSEAALYPDAPSQLAARFNRGQLGRRLLNAYYLPDSAGWWRCKTEKNFISGFKDA